MPKLIAIEWDAAEARVVVARYRGPDVELEQAFMIDLRPRGAEPPGEPRVGEKLAAALSARSVGRGEVLVAVGRASIELRQLSLPPAPREELPDLVRFQALRQFSNLGEDWPLDFTLLDSQGDSQNVLAAAISPELVEQIQEHCAGAGLKPKRLVLRPFAAASLLVRRQPQVTGCRLLVDWLADEVDLTVLIGEKVVFLRTVRLPAVEDTQQQAQALIREIRRTMAAAQNQLGGVGVERIVLCGQEEAGSDDSDASSTAERHRRHEVKGQIEDALSLPVEWLNPLDGFELGHELLKHRPRRPGRFAPLCGMILDEAAGARHSIDFLNPRKAASAASPRRKVFVWGAAAAATFLAIAAMMWIRLAMMDSEIAALQKQSKDLDKPLESARKLAQNVEAIEEFTTSDVSWIDEMRHLSESLPPAEQVMLSRLQVRASPKPQIEIEGQARASADVTLLEAKLRDERHVVYGKGVREDPKRTSYRFNFSETIDIKPEVEMKKKAAPGAAPKAAPGARASKAAGQRKTTNQKSAGARQ
jgi:Tfp pilus assembly PilM family ATPase